MVFPAARTSRWTSCIDTTSNTRREQPSMLTPTGLLTSAGPCSESRCFAPNRQEHRGGCGTSVGSKCHRSPSTMRGGCAGKAAGLSLLRPRCQVTAEATAAMTRSGATHQAPGRRRIPVWNRKLLRVQMSVPLTQVPECDLEDSLGCRGSSSASSRHPRLFHAVLSSRVTIPTSARNSLPNH
jgi:hypothetical protein